jgi:hypothetical protein
MEVASSSISAAPSTRSLIAMVRVAVVGHRPEWPFCGYDEMYNAPPRYALIDRQRLMGLLGIGDAERLDIEKFGFRASGRKVVATREGYEEAGCVPYGRTFEGEMGALRHKDTRFHRRIYMFSVIVQDRRCGLTWPYISGTLRDPPEKGRGNDKWDQPGFVLTSCRSNCRLRQGSF